jgi:hypothetical protein
LKKLIFLLGAGASVDAGLPTTATLTEEIRKRLPAVPDMNGNVCPEFAQLFDRIAEYDPEVNANYEKFFEWLKLIAQVQQSGFSRAICVQIEQRLARAAVPLAFAIKSPISDILVSRHRCAAYAPDYFTRLSDYFPSQGRLNVFTLNYDLCIEDACRPQGISVNTGFCPHTGRWTPSLFRSNSVGINLFKLHGSLNWRLNADQHVFETYPLNCENEHQYDPELVLGPGLKLQPDDPFATLYCEFRNALRRAKVCVVMGYAFHDEHLNTALREADGRGTTIVNVNPSPPPTNLMKFKHYVYRSIKAKLAFESGAICSTLSDHFMNAANCE